MVLPLLLLDGTFKFRRNVHAHNHHVLHLFQNHELVFEGGRKHQVGMDMFFLFLFGLGVVLDVKFVKRF